MTVSEAIGKYERGEIELTVQGPALVGGPHELRPTEARCAGATGSGLTTREITDGLEYIATSPAPEYGGFHPNTVSIAQGALEVILRLRVALEEIARLPTDQLASPEQCRAVVTAMDALSHPNTPVRDEAKPRSL